MIEFRRVMFSRLIPNLRYIGLMPERMHRHYAAAGLMDYYDGADASQLDHDKMMNDLENQSLESVL
jgi:hypothetical protein